MPGFGQSSGRIAGVSDVRMFPRVGKIRLGVKKTSQGGREYPAEVSYFILKPEDCATPTIHERWRKVYGEKPVEIDVMFPCEDPRVFFEQSYKRYGQSGLVCKGDGSTFSRIDRETGEILEGECPTPEGCDWCQERNRKGEAVITCKRIANLLVLLPRITWNGTFQIDTTSFHSIVQINSALDFYRPLAGRIAMVPFKLRREAKETQYGGKKATHYPMRILWPDTPQEIRGILDQAERVRDVFKLAGGGMALDRPGPREIESDLYPRGTAAGAVKGLPAPEEPGGNGERRTLTDAEKEKRRAAREPDPAEDPPPDDDGPDLSCHGCAKTLGARHKKVEIGTNKSTGEVIVICAKCEKENGDALRAEVAEPPGGGQARELQAKAAAAKAEATPQPDPEPTGGDDDLFGYLV